MQASASNRKLISVSLATVWVSKDSARPVDKPGLENPALIRKWLEDMTLDDKKDLYRNNLVETQALYGTIIEVIEDQGDWVKIIVTDQASKKDTRGYPGWIPKVQITEENSLSKESHGVLPYSELMAQEFILVTAKHCMLYDDSKKETIELSYVTKLPFLALEDDWVRVATPHGARYLKRDEVAIYNNLKEEKLATNGGEKIVEMGKRFLGLQYFWGGMSAYGYDCSGFAYNMHRALRIQIGRDASDQAVGGKAIEKEDLLPGDLVFFADNEGKGRVHHVGIYIGDSQMIHSPNLPESIKIDPLFGGPREKEYCGARRYWQ